MTPTTEPKQRPSQISETENIARKHLSAHNRLYFYVFTVLFYVTIVLLRSLWYREEHTSNLCSTVYHLCLRRTEVLLFFVVTSAAER